MIKMKLKHLVMTLVLLVSFSFLFVFILQPFLQPKIINNQIANGKIIEAKERVIDQIEKGSYKRLDLIKEFMIEPEVIGERYDVYIGSSMSSWSKNNHRLFSIEESEPYLRMYIKDAPADGYLRRTIEILRLYYQSTGELEKASEVIDLGISRFLSQESHYYDLQLIKIELMIADNNLLGARNLILEHQEKLTEQSTDVPLQLTKLLADIYVHQGEFEKAYLFLIEEVEKNKNWHDSLVADMKEDIGYQEGMSGSPYYNALVGYRDQLEQVIHNSEQLGHVTGKVTRSTREPLSGVGVFLRDERHVNQSVSNYERYQTITATDGSFSFTGVLPGKYQIHVGFMFEQIDGWAWPREYDDWLEIKSGESVDYPVNITPLIQTLEPTNYEVIRDQEVTFAWEPFEGAASYTLHGNLEFGGSSMGFQILSGINGAEVTLPVEKLYEVITGVMFEEDDWKTAKPESILGFANVEGMFSWSVKAYNESGKPLGQSNGYRLREETMGPLPFFHLKAREFTEADKVFMNGDVEAALSMYQKNVANDLSDTHSKRMVERILGIVPDN